jgi:DNA-dependent RNA polymerase auxiliary subunit epsilon
MPTFTGRFTARIEQDFEVEAATEEEARKLVEEHEMDLRFVTEAVDWTIESIEEEAD